MTRATIATRERIHHAAFILFCRYGFKRTSMEDIAAEAGLSRAALYLQFRNKEDIFCDLARELNAQSMAQVERALAEKQPFRSEERRVGKECRSRRAAEQVKRRE